MSATPGAALGVASWSCVLFALLLFVAMVSQGRPREGLEGLLEFGGQLLLGLSALLFLIIGAICGAVSVSSAAAAGDRRAHIGLPLLVNILGILGLVAFVLLSRPAASP